VHVNEHYDLCWGSWVSQVLRYGRIVQLQVRSTKSLLVEFQSRFYTLAYAPGHRRLHQS